MRMGDGDGSRPVNEWLRRRLAWREKQGRRPRRRSNPEAPLVYSSTTFALDSSTSLPMKYLCLAYEEEQLFHDMSEADWQSLRRETLEYVEHLRERGHLIDARPLQGARTASTLRVRDGRLSVTDGPFAETKEQIGGVFLIEAADFDEAVSIASKWPSARLGMIEVRPLGEGLDPRRRYGDRK